MDSSNQMERFTLPSGVPGYAQMKISPQAPNVTSMGY